MTLRAGLLLCIMMTSEKDEQAERIRALVRLAADFGDVQDPQQRADAVFHICCAEAKRNGLDRGMEIATTDYTDEYSLAGVVGAVVGAASAQ